MIYRNDEEMTVQQRENMRGGKGVVSVKQLLQPEEMLGKGRLFAELVIPVGASIGMHRHDGDSEAYYCLKGNGFYYNNDERFEMKPGHLAMVANHDSHGLENSGNEPLVVIGLVLFADEKQK